VNVILIFFIKNDFLTYNFINYFLTYNFINYFLSSTHILLIIYFFKTKQYYLSQNLNHKI